MAEPAKEFNKETKLGIDDLKKPMINLQIASKKWKMGPQWTLALLAMKNIPLDELLR